MAKRLLAGKLVELEENLGEGLLGNVVVIGGDADLVADDSKDLWRELLHKILPSRLGSRPHLCEEVLIDDRKFFHGVSQTLGRRENRGNELFVKSR